MTAVQRQTAGGESGWINAVTWIAIIAPLPYSLSRLLWAAGVPLGIDRQLLDDFNTPGWGSLHIVGLAALADATALLTHVIVRPRARTAPTWIPIINGRRVRPKLVIAALLLPTAVLTWRALHLTLVFGFRIPDDITGVPGWSLWTQAVLVWIWSLSLAAATHAYWRATRTRRSSGGCSRAATTVTGSRRVLSI